MGFGHCDRRAQALKEVLCQLIPVLEMRIAELSAMRAALET